MRIALLLAVSVFSAGCGMLKAPDVSNGSGGVAITRVVKAQGQGCAAPLVEGATGNVVTVPLRRHNNTHGDQSDQWVYWVAGSAQMVENPDDSFIQSALWDMRVKRPIPMISANGGDTAVNVSHLDAQAAQGAFAAKDDPTNWVADRNDGIEYGPIRLMPDNQNPLVNQPPSESGSSKGILASYDPGTHAVSFSGNIFFLRTTSGKEFYAVRFCEYSQADNWLKFQWIKTDPPTEK